MKVVDDVLAVARQRSGITAEIAGPIVRTDTGERRNLRLNEQPTETAHPAAPARFENRDRRALPGAADGHVPAVAQPDDAFSTEAAHQGRAAGCARTAVLTECRVSVRRPGKCKEADE